MRGLWTMDGSEPYLQSARYEGEAGRFATDHDRRALLGIFVIHGSRARGLSYSYWTHDIIAGDTEIITMPEA